MRKLEFYNPDLSGPGNSFDDLRDRYPLRLQSADSDGFKVGFDAHCSPADIRPS